MSAIIGRRETMNCLEAPAHSFTAGANPVSCEAALATVQAIEDQSLLQVSAEKGGYVRKRVDQWVSKYSSVGGVRGKSLSIGIDIVPGEKLKARGASTTLKICNYCFEHGVVTITVTGNALWFQPPLIVTYERLDTALNIMEGVLTALEAGNLDQYDISGQG